MDKRPEPTVAKLFWSGNSQAVRLPKEFRFEEGVEEVVIERRGEDIILRRPHIQTQEQWRKHWEDFFNSPHRPTDDFMQERFNELPQERSWE